MKTTLILGSFLAAAFLVGCATSTSPSDSTFGDSVRRARLAQTIDPDAGAKAGDPSVGVDARAARSTIDAYQDSFKTPQRTFEVLGIGGGLKGSQ